MYSFIFMLLVKESIWVWIQNPVVDIVIHVNSSFRLFGMFMVLRLFKELVISVILSRSVFRYLFCISDVGNREYSIVDVIIISNVLVVFFIDLVNDVRKVLFCFGKVSLCGFII